MASSLCTSPLFLGIIPCTSFLRESFVIENKHAYSLWSLALPAFGKHLDLKKELGWMFL